MFRELKKHIQCLTQPVRPAVQVICHCASSFSWVIHWFLPSSQNGTGSTVCAQWVFAEWKDTLNWTDWKPSLPTSKVHAPFTATHLELLLNGRFLIYPDLLDPTAELWFQNSCRIHTSWAALSIKIGKQFHNLRRGVSQQGTGTPLVSLRHSGACFWSRLLLPCTTCPSLTNKLGRASSDR